MEVPSWIGSEKRNFLSGFPHQEHTEWLECGNCHPEIFNIRKKSTKHFETIRILEGEFCGTCHLNVAFPISDCKRCHPDIKEFQ